MVRSFLSLCMSLAMLLNVSSTAFAVQPADRLAPATTKGFLSVDDMDELRARFNQTQLGELMNDPVMKPFTDDLKQQLENKLTQAGMRIGLTVQDLEGVYGGEVAMAVIQPNNDEKLHAMAMIVDVTGHLPQANELLTKVDRNMQQRNASRSQVAAAGIPMTVYTLPRKRGETETRMSILFLAQDQLVACDHLDTAKEIAVRVAGMDAGSTLSSVVAYTQSMKRCEEASGGETPQARWFIEPFGYAEVNRAANGGRKKRGTDMLKVLEHQGFDAIQGVGGWVWFKTDSHEVLHRSFVYAPPIALDNGQAVRERYRLAARMMQFPNQEPLIAQNWVPRELGTYVTFNWKMIDAFHYSETLVDELAGAEGVFADVLDGIKNDPTGPQVDLLNDLVAHFGERATVLGDAKLPVTPKSERLMFAIELTNAQAAQRTIDKAMSTDPNAKKRMFGKQVIWEIVNEEASEVPALQIDGGFGGFGDEPEEDEEKPVLPNSAVTVAHGHLLISSHVDFIVDLLKQVAAPDSLGQAADYQLVNRALNKLGADVESFRTFSRTDEAYRVTYELLKQNRMPESESMFGKMLNRMLGTGEKGVTREQEIDGSKMPEYDAVRRYLGPAGMYVHSYEDGWYIAGVLLHKDAAR